MGLGLEESQSCESFITVIDEADALLLLRIVRHPILQFEATHGK